ncbi:hypothetical protein BX666DRAFT_2009398 [Dichotomocladium elegans]|nr:hypothetical protein BX666DRAFT_2009398 [Dichotomocladium elegans]
MKRSGTYVNSERPSSPRRSVSIDERQRRASIDSTKYDNGAITTILHNVTFSSLLEDSRRERELNSQGTQISEQSCFANGLTTILEEDDLQYEPLTSAELEKFRRHFLKATQHLQSELHNSYVLLTGIGYVPAVITMIQFLEPSSYYFEKGQGQTYLYLVLAAISFYIISYSFLYYCLFPWFASSMTTKNIAPLRDLINPEDDPPTIWATLDYKMVRGSVNDRSVGLHYMPSVLGAYRLMYIIYDVASGILSFVMLTAILLSEKNENYYTNGGLEQLVFTIWIFVINTLLFLTHIYQVISTDKEIRHQWRERQKRIQGENFQNRPSLLRSSSQFSASSTNTVDGMKEYRPMVVTEPRDLYLHPTDGRHVPLRQSTIRMSY